MCRASGLLRKKNPSKLESQLLNAFISFTWQLASQPENKTIDVTIIQLHCMNIPIIGWIGSVGKAAAQVSCFDWTPHCLHAAEVWMTKSFTWPQQPGATHNINESLSFYTAVWDLSFFTIAFMLWKVWTASGWSLCAHMDPRALWVTDQWIYWLSKMIPFDEWLM